MNHYLLFGLITSAVGFSFVGYLANQLWTPTNDEGDLSSESQIHTNKTLHTLERYTLPIRGVVGDDEVRHTIDLTEIRQGCFRAECIPSVDDPQFVAPEALPELATSSLGIALSYADVERFYPFPMLETHEIVNDTIGGEPVLVTYCPLCGTGIVFERTIDDVAVSFGVSGMLWQSNLLMYNRADTIAEQNLWSQVLGEAVVGKRAGYELTIIPSDIMRFGDWQQQHPDGQVLTTGAPQDPYGGNYLRTAFSFRPDFDTNAAELAPDTYVYGVTRAAGPLAVVADGLPTGATQLPALGIGIIKDEFGRVTITDQEGTVLEDVEGFWFSWQAANPNTAVWQYNQQQ